MTTEIETETSGATFSLLPEKTGQALKYLITLSERLVELCDRETQAIVQNDMTTFSILQDEKEILAGKYRKSATEFNNRIEEFKGSDEVMLNRLEDLQLSLSSKLQSNKDISGKLYQRSLGKINGSVGTPATHHTSFPVNNLYAIQQQGD